MPLPEEEVVAPGHVLVVPKRLGARNLLDLKPDEMCAILATVQKAAIAQKNGLGATGFRVQQNNGLSGSQGAEHYGGRCRARRAHLGNRRLDLEIEATKPFTIHIFTSSPRSEEKRLELPRQGGSSRRRNTSRSRTSCVRPGPSSSQGASFLILNSAFSVRGKIDI